MPFPAHRSAARLTLALLLMASVVRSALGGGAGAGGSGGPGLDEIRDRFREGSYAMAREQAQAFLAEHPSGPQAQEARVVLACSQARLGQAVVALKALESLTTSGDLAPEVRALALAGQAQALMQVQGPNRWDEAANLYARAEAAYAALPQRGPAREDLVKLLQEEAQTAAQWAWQDKAAHAVAAYERLIKAEPGPEQVAQALLAQSRLVWSYSDAGDHKAKATTLLERVHHEYPETREAAEALHEIAQHHEQDQDLVKAVEVYRQFQQEYPSSDLINQVNNQVDFLTRPSLNISGPGVTVPGQKLEVSLYTRNVKQVALTAVSVDPVATVKAGASLQGNGAQLVTQGEVGSWSHETGDAGDYKPVSSTVPITLEKEGCYLIRARADGVEGATLVTITHLALVTKVAGKRLLAFVTDQKAGKPVADAMIAVGSDLDGGTFRHVEEQKTGADGLALFDLVVDPQRDTTWTLALAGDGAVAHAQGNAWWNNSPAQPSFVYAYTDRPVYRPDQAVHFRMILRAYDGKDYSVPVERTVQVTVKAPRTGKTVFEQSLTLSDYGTLSGDLTVPKDAPLGEYLLELRYPGSDQVRYEGGLFRVEEYRKPEFEVQVGTGLPYYQLGQEVPVTISARYYFGSAVTRGKVAWKVFRRASHRWWVPERPFAWFYAGETMPRWWDTQWVLLKEGKGDLDAGGSLSVGILTEKGWADSQLRVDAEVTDASRVVNTGSREVAVAHHAVDVFLSPMKFLYYPGEKIAVNAHTQTASGEPVAFSGRIHVAKVVRVKTEDEIKRDLDEQHKKAIEERGQGAVPDQGVTRGQGGGVAGGRASRGVGVLRAAGRARAFVGAVGTDIALGDEIDPCVYQELSVRDFKTLPQGEARFEWPSDSQGYFKITFEGKDPFGQPVEGVAFVWVSRPDAEDFPFRYSGCEVITDQDAYQPGDTARVLVTSEFHDAHVLLTVEADTIIAGQVLTLKGHSQTVELPVTDSDAPNVFISATLVHDGKVYGHSRQVFVPPARKLLKVTMTADKEVYRPREKGSFDLAVTDWQGKPVRTELSVGVADASVYAIAPDPAPEIRSFFWGRKRARLVQTMASIAMAPATGGRFGHTRRAYRSRALVEERGEDDAVRDKDAELDMAGGGMPQAADGGAAMPAEAKSMAAPAPAMAMRAGASGGKGLGSPGGGGGGGAPIAPVVREFFPDTAFWSPAIVTDAGGHAHLDVTFPDSLTTWKATYRAVTADTQVGAGELSVVTRKNLILRLKTPRFLTQRDTAALTLIVHNYLKSDKDVDLSMEASPPGLDIVGSARSKVHVTAQGEKSVDIVVSAAHAGTVTLLAKAVTDEESDAVRLKLPVIPHGIDKFIASSGQTKDKATVTLDVPKDRIPESTSLHLVITPSIASGLVTCLPYLAEYPYGCVEQTMSRFIPSVAVAQALGRLGIPRSRAAADLDERVGAGLSRLAGFQHGDGGWGWWHDDPSTNAMTALVVDGLARACLAGVAVDRTMIGRAVGFLARRVAGESQPETRAAMLEALGAIEPAFHRQPLRLPTEGRSSILAGWERANERAPGHQLFETYGERDKLSATALAYLAMALDYAGRRAEAGVCLRNLMNAATPDKANDTLRLGRQGGYCPWWEDAVETTSAGLRAVCTVEPDNAMATAMMRWLVLNRRGNRWKSTRDSAAAVYALVDFILSHKEESASMQVTIGVNGKAFKTIDIPAEHSLDFDGDIEIPRELLVDGTNTIAIAKTGDSVLYYSAHLTYFTLEEDIKGSGDEILVSRKYSRLTEVKNAVGTARSALYERSPLESGGHIAPGDLIEVELDIKAKNDYEYLMFEEPKPAGCEPTEKLSGPTADYDTGTWSERELRDQKLVFFETSLAQGDHVIRYRLRAETPGQFHVRPTSGQAMYVPEVRGTADEFRLEIKE